MDSLQQLLDFDWPLVLHHVVDMVIAYMLALPIGWDREKHERTAGLRTFPLVAVAACGYTLVGLQVLEGSTAHSRVIQGIITGMGFIGGGAILKSVSEGKGRVQGTATAASLWATGAIGLAVATARLEIAVVLSAMTFLTLQVITSAKEHLPGAKDNTGVAKRTDQDGSGDESGEGER
ncbi:MgtC/SapB family protein [Microbulbifer yueqingensis]|uniref:Protein MgtC n=1 Tax=Microbulbifer yueqingensis TaxID=658219 RepID=A0A1G8Y5G1_9GAMM|nr:MgtC/SapB family protein [Microbulbifer yueqingensis]SDJ97991.1 putative Mg2+ transporter-C (MgtC) family protein [Microbulbifer yueqingensis]